MNNPPMSIHIDDSYGVGYGNSVKEVYVKLHVAAKTSGLIRELGPDLWTTLCVLATYMDANGSCYPTIEQMADELGVSYSTAQRWLNRLFEFRWYGRPVIFKAQGRYNGNYANNRYTILPLSQLSIFQGEVETPPDVTNEAPPDAKRDKPPDVTGDVLTRTNINKNQYKQNNTSSKKTEKVTKSNKAAIKDSDSKKEIKDYNASDIVKYFANKYKDKYGVDYVPNFKIEAGQIKSKLLPAFGSERLCQIIDVVMAMYDQKWSTTDYPRPSIGQLASWLANKAVAFVDDRKPVDTSSPSDYLGDYDKLMRKLQGERG